MMTVFEEVKVDSQYWTGYNSDLLDCAIERGNSIEQTVDRIQKLDRRVLIRNVWTVIVTTIASAACVAALFCMSFFGIINPERDEKIFDYAYKLGQSHAISGTVYYALVQNRDGESVFTEIDKDDTPDFYSIEGDWKR